MDSSGPIKMSLKTDVLKTKVPNIWHSQMCGSSDIQSVLIIGVKYWNCHRTLDVYLLAAMPIGKIQSKPIYKLVTYRPSSPLSNFDWICPIQIANVNKHPKFLTAILIFNAN